MMVSMLIVGYCHGIRSERQLCLGRMSAITQQRAQLVIAFLELSQTPC